MSSVAALPFRISRTSSVMGWEVISTSELVHGLLLLEGDRLVIQWRRSRAIQRVGMEIRTDRELEDVREVTVPVSALAGARVRWQWKQWPPGRFIVLTGADLRAFEEIAGSAGLGLDHPAELVLQLRYSDLLAAREFAGEIEMAIAERALRAADRTPQVEAPGPAGEKAADALPPAAPPPERTRSDPGGHA